MQVFDMPSSAKTQLNPERLTQFTFGFAPPLIIESAIRHRVFNVLDEGAKTIEQVSAETCTSPRGLGAIMNVLVALDLLSKDNDGRYALTAESSTFLVPGKATFCGAFFLLTSGPMLSAWRKLHEIVRSGRPEKNIDQERDGVPFSSLSRKSFRSITPQLSAWPMCSASRKLRRQFRHSTWGPAPAYGASRWRSNLRTSG